VFDQAISLWGKMEGKNLFFLVKKKVTETTAAVTAGECGR